MTLTSAAVALIDLGGYLILPMLNDTLVQLEAALLQTLSAAGVARVENGHFRHFQF